MGRPCTLQAGTGERRAGPTEWTGRQREVDISKTLRRRREERGLETNGTGKGGTGLPEGGWWVGTGVNWGESSEFTGDPGTTQGSAGSPSLPPG